MSSSFSFKLATGRKTLIACKRLQVSKVLGDCHLRELEVSKVKLREGEDAALLQSSPVCSWSGPCKEPQLLGF